MTTTARGRENLPPADAPKRHQQASPSLTFNGQQFAGHTALARHLVALSSTGHSIAACMLYLRKFGDDADRVLAEMKSIADRRQPKTVDVNSRNYESRTAFARNMGRRYHISFKIIKRWIFVRRMPLNEIEPYAKEWRRRHGPKITHETVILFGWEFRSLKSACLYYGHTYNERQRRSWRRHLAAGKPAYEFFLSTLTRLWQADELDDRNRYCRPELESKRPRTSHPLNQEPLPITDAGEARFVNAVHPADARTFPRACRDEILRLRARVEQAGLS
jgi:hypothetical protein